MLLLLELVKELEGITLVATLWRNGMAPTRVIPEKEVVDTVGDFERNMA